jgi:hypothetical protein
MDPLKEFSYEIFINELTSYSRSAEMKKKLKILKDLIPKNVSIEGDTELRNGKFGIEGISNF